MSNTNTKTPIVYYGGKTAIWNHIEPLIPSAANNFLETDSYSEEFLGGGTVFWSKEPVKNETINDRLDLVVNFYRCLKLRYRPLKRLINATLVSRKIHGEGLKLIRAHAKGKKVPPVQLAWAFWLCTNFAYSNKIGGGYKYSNHMSVSVPDTMTRRKNQFTEMLAARLEHTYIENEDAIHVARSRNVKNCFHYIDPPYPNADQGHYAGYGWDQYTNLLEFCADECKGKFLLSSYESEVLAHYIEANGWNSKTIKHRLQAPRKSGAEKIEILVWNYDISYIHQPSLFQ